MEFKFPAQPLFNDQKSSSLSVSTIMIIFLIKWIWTKCRRTKFDQNSPAQVHKLLIPEMNKEVKIMIDNPHLPTLTTEVQADFISPRF